MKASFGASRLHTETLHPKGSMLTPTRSMGGVPDPCFFPDSLKNIGALESLMHLRGWGDSLLHLGNYLAKPCHPHWSAPGTRETLPY